MGSGANQFRNPSPGLVRHPEFAQCSCSPARAPVFVIVALGVVHGVMKPQRHADLVPGRFISTPALEELQALLQVAQCVVTAMRLAPRRDQQGQKRH